MDGFTGTGLACIRGDRIVFAGLDFAVAPGEALILSGPNGSGKSSLLRLMAGIAPPAAGDITWQAYPHNAQLEVTDPALIKAGLVSD